MLARSEASEMLQDSEEACYPMFRTLLESCRALSDSGDAPRVGAAVMRLGLISLAPAAMAQVQGIEIWCE